MGSVLDGTMVMANILHIFGTKSEPFDATKQALDWIQIAEQLMIMMVENVGNFVSLGMKPVTNANEFHPSNSKVKLSIHY